MKILIGKNVSDTRIIGHNGVDLTSVLGVKRIVIEVDARMTEPKIVMEFISDVEVGGAHVPQVPENVDVAAQIPTHTEDAPAVEMQVTTPQPPTTKRKRPSA